MDNKINIDKLLINRSDLTLSLGLAGLPIAQMTTHVPYFENIKKKIYSKNYAYYTILNKSQPEKLTTKNEYNISLFNKIKNEGVDIINPITGFPLHTKTEIYGGHHRAVCAYLNNIKEIPIEYKNLELFNNTNAQSIQKAYFEATKTEAIRKGCSYNPVPGLKPIRKGIDRIKMIYEDIVDCRGKELIDLGCNDGYFGIFFGQHAFNITFVERSPAYSNIVKKKLETLNMGAKLYTCSIFDYLKKYDKKFDVIIYLDVFYHTVVEKGLDYSLKELEKIINIGKKIFIAPGRWDKLQLTEKDLFEWVLNKNKRLRYIGRDDDGKNYEREIYCIE